MTIRFMHSVVFLFLFCASSSFALNVQFGSEPTQFDPLFLEDGTALRIAANVIATPYEYDGAGNLRKSLASSLSVSKDRKKYTIRFRKGLKWSDGVKFEAKQFMAAVRRLVKEPVKAALSELFPEIDLAKSRVLDVLTVEVVLKAPDAQFVNWLTLPPFSPIRDEMLPAFEKRNPVVPTLAAYQVIEYKREDFLLLKKNPEYFEKDSVSVDQVKIRFIKEEANLVSMLRSGDLDILCKVPVLQLDQVRKVGQLVEVPVEAVTYLGLNTRKPPFNEVANRRAFLKALFFKRGELADALKTGELPAFSFLPKILIPSSVKLDAKDLDVNPVKSTEKLKFSIQTDGGSRNSTILEYVQSQVKDEYRWAMSINVMDWKAQYAKLKSSPDEGFRFGWQNPVSDPYVMYQVLQTRSPNNFTGWSNAEYDRLVQELKQEKAFVKKEKLIGKIEAILMKEAPVIPLLHQVLRFAHTKRVQGFRANSFGVIVFREIRLTEN